VPDPGFIVDVPWLPPDTAFSYATALEPSTT
jgi:hypothetical protein